MFLRSIPTSRVTPSPNLKLDAATLKHIIGTKLHDKLAPKHLESVFLLHCVHRCREFPELVKCRGVSMGRRFTTMTWTRGMLRSIYKTNYRVSCSNRRHRSSDLVTLKLEVPIGNTYKA